MLRDEHIRVARLMRRVRKEDERAELQVFVRYHPMVTRLARWWLNRDPDLARSEESDDIAQEAWRRYYQGVREARWTVSESWHVATLLALLVRDVAREQVQYHHRLCRDIDRTQRMSASSEAIDAQAQPDEHLACADLVERALGMLAAPERCIVEAWMTEGRWAEIAQRTGLTAEAARKRCERALQAIRRGFRSGEQTWGGALDCRNRGYLRASQMRTVIGQSTTQWIVKFLNSRISCPYRHLPARNQEGASQRGGTEPRRFPR